MIKAYWMMGHDNGSHFYDKAPNSILCGDCGSVIDDTYIRSGITFKKKLDISSTFDNVTVVNNRFVEFCEKYQIENVDFVKINIHEDFYVLRPRNIVVVDKNNSNIIEEGFCTKCKEAKGVYCPEGFSLISESPINHGLFKTDLRFSERLAKNPAIIVGKDTASLLKKLNFSGIWFKECN